MRSPIPPQNWGPLAPPPPFSTSPVAQSPKKPVRAVGFCFLVPQYECVYLSFLAFPAMLWRGRKEELRCGRNAFGERRGGGGGGILTTGAYSLTLLSHPFCLVVSNGINALISLSRHVRDEGEKFCLSACCIVEAPCVVRTVLQQKIFLWRRGRQNWWREAASTIEKIRRKTSKLLHFPFPLFLFPEQRNLEEEEVQLFSSPISLFGGLLSIAF